MCFVVVVVTFLALVGCAVPGCSSGRLAVLFTVAFGAGAVHFENGWNYTSRPDGGWEYGIFLFTCCVGLYLTGPGKYTLSHFRGNS